MDELITIEVARIVHFLRQHLAGKTLSKVTAQVDENVYGKVGCSAEAFEEAMTGKKVLDAKQQGKYFWYVRSYRIRPFLSGNHQIMFLLTICRSHSTI